MLDAGKRLFAARAVEGVTIDQIVAAAGVAKGTFYIHFEGRDDLERSIVLALRAVVERSVLAVNADIRDPAYRIARAMCVYFRFAVDEPDGAAMLARMPGSRATFQSPLNRGIVSDVRTGIRSGRLEAVSAESGILFVMGATKIVLLKLAENHSLRTAATTGRTMVELVLRGFGLTRSEAETLALHASDRIVRRCKPSEITS